MHKSVDLTIALYSRKEAKEFAVVVVVVVRNGFCLLRA